MRFIRKALFASALLLSLCAAAEEKPLVQFLAIADIQYADKEPAKTRFYSNSLAKLDKIFSETAGGKFDFLITLGDMVDAKYANLPPVLERLSKFTFRQYHVMGNHDFADTQENVEKIAGALKLKAPYYYYFDIGAWRFIALDSNKLGKYYKLGDAELEREAAQVFAKAEAEHPKRAKSWNGGVDKEQLEWLGALLKKTAEENMHAAIFAHSPLSASNSHAALNTEEILDVITKHPCARLYINGHDHRGGYELFKGLHLLNLSGLVEGETEASYAEIKICKDKIIVEGRGNTPSRVLELN